MVATGFINSILFGSMGLCKQCLQNDSTKPISIKDTMLCGIFTGNLLYRLLKKKKNKKISIDLFIRLVYKYYCYAYGRN